MPKTYLFLLFVFLVISRGRDVFNSLVIYFINKSKSKIMESLLNWD